LRSLDWNWGDARDGQPDTSGPLREAMAKNPYMRIYIASGYYDLATPYYATAYTLSHLPLAPETRANVRTEEYPVGHMVYLEIGTLAKLQADVARFIGDAMASAPKPLRG